MILMTVPAGGLIVGDLIEDEGVIERVEEAPRSTHVLIAVGGHWRILHVEEPVTVVIEGA